MKHLEFLEKVKADPNWEQFIKWYKENPEYSTNGRFVTSFAFVILPESFQLTALVDWFYKQHKIWVLVQPIDDYQEWIYVIEYDCIHGLDRIKSDGTEMLAKPKDATHAGILKALKLLPTITT